MRLELPILKLSPQAVGHAPRRAPIPDAFAVTLPVGMLVELAGSFRPQPPLVADELVDECIDGPDSAQPDSDLLPIEQH